MRTDFSHQFSEKSEKRRKFTSVNDGSLNITVSLIYSNISDSNQSFRFMSFFWNADYSVMLAVSNDFRATIFR